MAIPLVVRGRAVAVLYADSAGLDSESINLEALETLVTVSGMAVELLSASRTAPKKVAEEAPAPAPEPEPAYAPASEYAAEPPAPMPEPSFSGAETIESYQPEPVPVEPESFVEAVPVDEPAGVFEETPATGACR